MHPMYPPSPEHVPPELLKVPGSYRARVFMMLLAIFVFLAVYLSLVGLSIYLVYFSISKMTDNDAGVFHVLFVGGAVMLALFMVKFLFKFNKSDNPGYREITEEEEPRLFAFVRELCEETRAPFPKKIFLTSDINAAVFYNSTIWSLFLPTRKNLLIGLGLVNALTLSEFKAVLAHEFGHFSQSSMRLGSYVYTANNIIYNMVYERDRWDDLLSAWAGIDIRISFPAWILIGLVWVIRGLLSLLFKLMNLIHAALSRQMEFNADLVAVSVTGSDAIISALSKINTGSEAMGLTYIGLTHAADHKLFSSDLYFHQSAALRHLSAQQGSQEKPGAKGKRIFQKSEFEVTDMYSSHPSDFDREVNAKRIHVEGAHDPRSPWVLFDHARRYREHFTKVLYEANLELDDDVCFADPDEVERFISEERTESMHSPRFQGAFLERTMTPFDESRGDRFAKKYGITPDSLRSHRDTLFSDETKGRLAQIAQDEAAFGQLLLIHSGQVKSGSINGKKVTRAGVGKMLERQVAALESHEKWYTEFDKKTAALFLVASRVAGREAEFLEIFTFHQTLMKIIASFNECNGRFEQLIRLLNEVDELSEDDLGILEADFNDVGKELKRLVKKANTIKLPELKNLGESDTVGSFIAPGTIYTEGSLSEGWLNTLGGQLSQIGMRLNRLNRKSMASLLAFVEPLLFDS